MRLYIEHMQIYNDLEAEMQLLELSILIETKEGNKVYENHLTYAPIFGVDRDVAIMLGHKEKVVGSNTSKEDFQEEFQRINEIIDEDTQVIIWTNTYTQLPQIKSGKRVVLKSSYGSKVNLRSAYFSAFGKEMPLIDSKDRVYAIRELYLKLIEDRTREHNQTG